MTGNPLSYFEISDAIWSPLSRGSEFHWYAINNFMSGESIADAESDAMQHIVQEIEGNATTPAEALAMAYELIKE